MTELRFRAAERLLGRGWDISRSTRSAPTGRITCFRGFGMWTIRSMSRTTRMRIRFRVTTGSSTSWRAASLRGCRGMWRSWWCLTMGIRPSGGCSPLISCWLSGGFCGLGGSRLGARTSTPWWTGAGAWLWRGAGTTLGSSSTRRARRLST